MNASLDKLLIILLNNIIYEQKSNRIVIVEFINFCITYGLTSILPNLKNALESTSNYDYVYYELKNGIEIFEKLKNFNVNKDDFLIDYENIIMYFTQKSNENNISKMSSEINNDKNNDDMFYQNGKYIEYNYEEGEFSENDFGELSEFDKNSVSREFRGKSNQNIYIDNPNSNSVQIIHPLNYYDNSN